jgi:site-specific DNA-methyltransferase (adenine-specific)
MMKEDPFCGSGTTAKMAMLTGRKFIGFEISAEYCDIAEKRIASVGKDIPLFEAD